MVPESHGHHPYAAAVLASTGERDQARCGRPRGPKLRRSCGRRTPALVHKERCRCGPRSPEWSCAKIEQVCGARKLPTLPVLFTLENYGGVGAAELGYDLIQFERTGCGSVIAARQVHSLCPKTDQQQSAFSRPAAYHHAEVSHHTQGHRKTIRNVVPGA